MPQPRDFTQRCSTHRRGQALVRPWGAVPCLCSIDDAAGGGPGLLRLLIGYGCFSMSIPSPAFLNSP